MISGLEPLTEKISPRLTRTQILEAHAKHESEQQSWTPSMRYSDLLAIVYKRLAEQWSIKVNLAECITYGQSVKNWPAFDDSKAALGYLQQHYKLVILSNVDNASFDHSNQKLGVEFDAIFTAEDIGSYKPSDNNFKYMLSKLEKTGINKESILHTAESMFHDHVPGKKHGLATSWIYRRNNQEGFGATMHPGKLPAVDFQFNSMAELVEAHKLEQNQ